MPLPPLLFEPSPAQEREFIECKTSMIADEAPLRVLLFYQDFGFSHTLNEVKQRRRRSEDPQEAELVKSLTSQTVPLPPLPYEPSSVS